MAILIKIFLFSKRSFQNYREIRNEMFLCYEENGLSCKSYGEMRSQSRLGHVEAHYDESFEITP